MNCANPFLICLNDADNVAVARVALCVGQNIVLGGKFITVRNPIAAGHKLALESIAVGQPILKYGQIIGLSTLDIQAGDHVHQHNVAMLIAQPDHGVGAFACIFGSAGYRSQARSN